MFSLDNFNNAMRRKCCNQDRKHGLLLKYALQTSFAKMVYQLCKKALYFGEQNF